MITITLCPLGGGAVDVLLVGGVELLVVGVGVQVLCPWPHAFGLTFAAGNCLPGVSAGLLATPYTKLPTRVSAAIQIASNRFGMPAPYVDSGADGVTKP
jgi:hypothetical protein